MFKTAILSAAILSLAVTQGQTEDLPYEDWQHANVEGVLTGPCRTREED